MSYIRSDFTFPSSDGKNTVYAVKFEPKDVPVKAVVQVSHGMIDYIDRYAPLAEYLTKEGYVIAGNEHLGHGRTAKTPEDLGYFAERDGWSLVVEDLYKMNRILREEYSGLPLILMGHSMGSFLARLYAVRYPESINALIIHGTGGKNPMLKAGKAVVSFIRKLRGSRHRSALVGLLAFGTYNSKFPKSDGINAWLTRDVARVASRQTDPYTSFNFTLAAYNDLFTMLGECNSDEWYSNYPKDMPTLVISGECDPVGDYGKGVREVHAGLCSAGVKDLTLKIYPECRHELFYEYNSEEIFSDMHSWLEKVIAE
ncbi:MAG: lysophospholipase [Clostridia bacterium]|nr:lysophospholipase [Clostridia bacterium]